MPEFEVSRSTTVLADPERVHELVDDLRAWQQWSPWEQLDPDLQREYSGAESGVGARYAWSGNKKAGAGSMEITASTPEEVRVRLVFLKPFKAENDVDFTIRPVADGTAVTWRMRGQQKGLMGLVGRFLPMDKLVGKDFERGLAQLKECAERG